MANGQTTTRKFRFTVRGIETLPTHTRDSPSREAEYSDSEVTGLRILVSKNGRKFFHFRYTYNRRKCVIRIGEFPAITLSEARTTALEFRNMLARNLDPQLERNKHHACPTFMEFANDEYLPHAKSTKKSWKDDYRKIEADLLPTFGKLTLAAISAKDLQLFLNRVQRRSSNVNANRHYALLSKMFNMAVHWEHIEKSPMSGVQKFKESSHRERFLSNDEIQRLLSVLEQNTKPIAASLLRLLLFTGMRCGEAETLRWEFIDFQASSLRLPDTKSGKSRTVVLNSLAMAELEHAKSFAGNPYVFPGKEPKTHYHSPRRAFEEAKQEAGIENFRIHDLRHTYASLAVNSGASLYEVQRLLGHSNASMTQRYAHLADSAVRDATNGVANSIGRAVRT